MQIIENMEHFEFAGRTCVTLGKYDGIHLGHQAIIDRVFEVSGEELLKVAFTFSPSPASFFSGRMIPDLMTKEEKRVAFEKAGFDYLWEFPLNERTAATDPLTFIEDIIYKDLKASVIVGGDDISFGFQGRGDAALLRENESKFGYRLEMLPKVSVDDMVVSSSLIREYVSEGNMEQVARLLGAPYEIHGFVETGAGKGRQFGFPTLNLYPSEDKMLPPFGVYYADVITSQGTFHAVTDIGVKPTVTSEGRKVVESYLYGFEGDLDDNEITVVLLSYRRPEFRFESIDELVRTIGEDKIAGEKYFGL